MVKKYVETNETGRIIGEGHHRAKLSNLEVNIIQTLLQAREEAIGLCLTAGLTQSEIDAHVARAGLSYRLIAERFGVQRALIWKIANGLRRCQTPMGFRDIKDGGEEGHW